MKDVARRSSWGSIDKIAGCMKDVYSELGIEDDQRARQFTILAVRPGVLMVTIRLD